MYINLDLETTSGADLKKVGVYVYAADPDFAIQLLAYSVDGGPVHQIDLTKGETLPSTLRDLLLNPKVIKRAYNAAFERICLSAHILGEGFIDPQGWECTSVRSSASGLPASLDEVCKALDLPDGASKKDGKRLIRLFSIAKADPEEYPAEWNAYKAYNRNDVVAEMTVRDRLDKECVFTDQALYELDQRINDRGVMLDTVFISRVIQLENGRRTHLENEVKGLTFLTNPNSPMAFAKWISLHLGIEVTSANKDTLAEIETDDELALKVLAARRELSLSSVKKFAPMQAGASEDGRIRGLFRCYGAGRTGRWSSVRVQLQNLAKGDGKLDIATAKSIAHSGHLGLLTMCYPEPMKILSSLVRPSLIASAGNELVIGDFSSIEARIIAWYADEKWALEVFAGHGAIYEAAAARMYHRPVDEIIAGYEAGEPEAKDQRAKGKIATLALGYQGAVGALSKMGGEKMGLSAQEMQLIVNAWRQANPNIVRLWYTVEECVRQAIGSGQIIRGPKGLQFKFYPTRRILSIRLPSGRFLYYRDVRMIGKICYAGYSSTARVWGKQETYGGKLVENIVQATARDCLSEAMLRADLEGLPIVMHVHDEIVLDAPKNGYAKELKALMIAPPIWAAGLPLDAKVETSDYYTK